LVKDAAKLLIPDRNIVTVETFRNGKLRQRAKTHNMITQPGLDWLKYKRDYGLNTGIAAGKNTHKVPYDVFNTLVALSDSTPPTLGENYNLSDVIAWANKTAYTGADTKRGTVNLAESYCTDDLIHWAIDFPTHAGNDGLINSIAWEYCNSISDFIQGVTNTNTESLISYLIGGINKKLCTVDLLGNFWVLGYGAGMNTNGYLHKIDPITNTLIHSYGPYTWPTSNPENICIFGNTAIFIDNYAKISLINISDGSLISQYQPATITPYIAYDGSHFWGWKATDKIVKYKADFSDDTIYTIPGAAGISNLQYDPITECITVKANGNQMIFINKQGIIANKIACNDSLLLRSGNILYTGTPNPAKYREYTTISQGARALLPVPIQKTAADTMRITYDFDIRF
jgi:hypothetical protein